MPSMSFGISRPCQCIENGSGSRFSTLRRTRSPSVTWMVGPGMLPLNPQPSMTRPGIRFGADVLDANVEHLDAVLQPPRHVRDIGADDRDDPGPSWCGGTGGAAARRARRRPAAAAPDARAAHKRFARKRRPQWTPAPRRNERLLDCMRTSKLKKPTIEVEGARRSKAPPRVQCVVACESAR